MAPRRQREMPKPEKRPRVRSGGRAPAGSVLPPIRAAGRRDTSEPPPTPHRPEALISADRELVNRLQTMTEADYMLWRDTLNVSWSEVAEEDLPLLCRTCRLFSNRDKSRRGGSTIYDHMSSARHMECINRAKKQAPKSQFPVFSVPVCATSIEGGGFQVCETPVETKQAARKKSLREKDKAAIEGMLRYAQNAGATGSTGNTSFRGWADRSLSQDNASDVRKKEAIAREVALELANLFIWGEEATRDYSVQDVASGDRFHAGYTLGIEFLKYSLR